jgi:hypothetical protein
MQSLRERTTVAEREEITFTEPIRAKTGQRLRPSAKREDRSTVSITENGKRVRTSESVPSELFLCVVVLWQTAAHQVSRRSGGLPCERRTVARTIFAPSCPMLSSIGHQGTEHIQV